MKIEVPIKALLEAAGAVSVNPTKSEHSSCIRFDAAEQLSLTATELDYWSTQGCPEARVLEPGSLLLHTDMLKGLLRSFRGETITITQQGGHVLLKALGQSAAKLATADLSAYPVAPPIGSRQRLIADLAPAMRLLPAMAETDVRGALHGLRIEEGDGKLNAYAANGHIAASTSIEREGTCAEPIFIPAPQAPKACALGTVAITKTSNYLVFENNLNTTRIKQSAFESMDIGKALKAFQFDASAVIIRDEALSAFSSAHCLRQPKDQFVIVTVTQMQGALKIEAQTPRGSFNHILPCKSSGSWGSWGSARLTTENLIWALQSGGEDVTMHFGDPKLSVRIDDGNFSAYMAPMRLT